MFLERCIFQNVQASGKWPQLFNRLPRSLRKITIEPLKMICYDVFCQLSLLKKIKIWLLFAIIFLVVTFYFLAPVYVISGYFRILLAITITFCNIKLIPRNFSSFCKDWTKANHPCCFCNKKWNNSIQNVASQGLKFPFVFVLWLKPNWTGFIFTIDSMEDIPGDLYKIRIRNGDTWFFP